MSSPTTLNSIINKLLTLPNTYSTFYINGPNVEPKKVELKQLIPNTSIDDFNYRMLAVFLQYVNLNIFTNEELQFLLNLDYSSLENNTLVGGIKNFDYTRPMYDVGGNLFNNNTELSEINNTFNKLHSLNKNLNVAFFISFIITQI